MSTVILRHLHQALNILLRPSRDNDIGVHTNIYVTLHIRTHGQIRSILC
jgi:hypothetical protein